MSTLTDLFHASPAELEQMMVGIAAGAVLISALLISRWLRTVAFTLAALVVCSIALMRGLGGLTSLAHRVLTDIRAHQALIKGIIAGKVMAAALWHLNSRNPI